MFLTQVPSNPGTYRDGMEEQFTGQANLKDSRGSPTEAEGEGRETMSEAN